MHSSENSSRLRLRQPNRTISPGITFVIIYRFFHNSVMQEAFPEQICSGRALLFRRFTLILLAVLLRKSPPAAPLEIRCAVRRRTWVLRELRLPQRIFPRGAADGSGRRDGRLRAASGRCAPVLRRTVGIRALRGGRRIFERHPDTALPVIETIITPGDAPHPSEVFRGMYRLQECKTKSCQHLTAQQLIADNHIAFIIPTKDRPADLCRIFDSLQKQTRKPDQVIIVDASP